MTAMIDMHAHWRPAQVADALRARTREPRIVRNPDGVEVLKASRMGEEPLAKAFDDVDFHLDRMDRQGVETSVLSLLGSFCWVEALPLDESGPLCRTINDGLSAICQKHPGRFAAYAALPLTDISAAAAELERALGLPGMMGASRSCIAMPPRCSPASALHGAKERRPNPPAPGHGRGAEHGRDCAPAREQSR